MKIVQICKYRNSTVEGVDLFEEVLRAAEGHSRKFYILNGDAGDLSDRLGCETVTFDLSKSAIKHIRLSAVLTVLKRLRHDKPDVIVTHRFKPAVFAAWLAPLFFRKTRKIAVIHNVGEFKKPRRLIFARTLMRRWIFVACSEAVRQDMLSRNFPSSQVIAIPNSVDEKLVRDNQLSREQARQDLGIPADAKRVVGTIGRMRPVKGHKYFLEAMRDMEAPPYVAVIGDGELLDEMRAAARESNLSHRLIFAGGRKNAYRYMAAFDAFVMPSLREGLPIAMLEAIASGVPAFGTPVGGIPEILKNRKWVFPKEDPEALRQILIHIANATDEQLEETRQSQQKIFRDNFSIDQYRSRFRSLMEGTVQHSD